MKNNVFNVSFFEIKLEIAGKCAIFAANNKGQKKRASCPALMFSQRNNPYCDLLEICLVSGCKDKVKNNNFQIFFQNSSNEKHFRPRFRHKQYRLGSHSDR